MAAWLIPALKAILPHVGTIVSAASPVFTKKKEEAGQAGLVQQQIAELQAAASQNADHIRELAEQLRTTVAALEQTSSMAEAKLRRASFFSYVAMAVACVSLLLTVFGHR